MEVFNKLLLNARDLKLVEGTVLESNSKKFEVTHIFFADDSLIFCKPDARMLLNLRCILLCFQAVFGLKINLYKYELVGIEKGSNGNHLAKVLGCVEMQFPIKYLGFPLVVKFKDKNN